MANTNANIVPVRLAVFDDRRGHKEGNEHEKMLCYYPPAIPLTDQINHVGFAQACAMFADNFGPEVRIVVAPRALVETIAEHCYTYRIKRHTASKLMPTDGWCASSSQGCGACW